MWQDWDCFLSLWESQRWWFRGVGLVEFPTLSLCPSSLLSPYVYFRELLESWPCGQLGWQRRTPWERCLSQPSRAGQLYKPCVWGIAVSWMFSVLLPVKLVILSVQQSRLRLTQTLQFCFKKKKSKKRLSVSVFPQSPFYTFYWYTSSSYWKRNTYLPDTE